MLKNKIAKLTIDNRKGRKKRNFDESCLLDKAPQETTTEVAEESTTVAETGTVPEADEIEASVTRPRKQRRKLNAQQKTDNKPKKPTK